MLYTVYKITNQINGKIYIGCHKTNDLNDNYMGSGKYLIRAQKKYGLDNFTKEILFVFDNPDDMYNKEAEIVNADFLAEENTYNLKLGGMGGFDYINANSNSADYISVRRNNGLRSKTKGFVVTNARRKEDSAHLAQIVTKANETKQKNSLEKYGDAKECYRSFAGKKHTEETKKKIGRANSKHQSGTGNSQYGTRWITNGHENSKILTTDSIPDGWVLGRKSKACRNRD